MNKNKGFYAFLYFYFLITHQIFQVYNYSIKLTVTPTFGNQNNGIKIDYFVNVDYIPN